MNANHIIVHAGPGIPSDALAKAMFDMELALRRQGIPAEVLKETAPDDSKLRNVMTLEMRKSL